MGGRAERRATTASSSCPTRAGSSSGSRRYGVPTIHFGVGTGAILGELREAGGDVIGADWRTPLDEAWERIGFDRAIQGNLDPTLLLGPLDRALAATDDVLERAGGRPGHIFNLGHGILPSTPVEHVQALARYVHQRRDDDGSECGLARGARSRRRDATDDQDRCSPDGARHAVVAGRDAGVSPPRSGRAAAVAGARRRDAAQLRGDRRALAAHRADDGAGGGAASTARPGGSRRRRHAQLEALHQGRARGAARRRASRA